MLKLYPTRESEFCVVQIWHVGASRNSQTVNGANQAVWALARAQSRSGHDVSMIVSRGGAGRYVATEETIAESVSAGSTAMPSIKLCTFAQAVSRLGVGHPDVIHMHSVYSPAQSLLALVAKLRRVPYVVTPHGGYMSSILARHGLLKRLYRSTIERSRLRGAAAAIAVADPEADDIRTFGGTRAMRIVVAPNIVEADTNRTPSSTGRDSESFDVVYLGRLEVTWKGIDRIVEIAEHLPHRQFGLFGAFHPSMSTLDLPANVTVRSPIYGDEKFEIVSRSKVLVQLSRWEVFGMSVVEALLTGTQVMTSDTMYITPWVESIGGLVYRDSDSASAAAALESYLSRSSNGAEADERRSAATRFIDPNRIIASLDSLYSELLSER